MQDSLVVDPVNEVDRRQAEELMEDALNRIAHAPTQDMRDYWSVMAAYWADLA